jgi:hypothetical protein
MSIKLGSTDISKIYLGSSEIQKVYQGSNLVYSSVFNPLSLSPLLWLDGNDESTIIHSSNIVSEWRDKSGNGNNLTQNNTSFKPIYNVNKIRFDNYQRLYTSGSFDVKNVFIVASIDNVTHSTNRWIYNLYNDGVNRQGIYIPINNDGIGTWVSDGAPSIPGSSSLLPYPQTTSIYEHQIINTYDKIKNSLSESTRYFNITIPLYSNLSIGWWMEPPLYTGTVDFSPKASISEILFFDKILTDTERTNINNYLTNKWNL